MTVPAPLRLSGGDDYCLCRGNPSGAACKGNVRKIAGDFMMGVLVLSVQSVSIAGGGFRSSEGHVGVGCMSSSCRLLPVPGGSSPGPAVVIGGPQFRLQRSLHCRVPLRWREPSCSSYGGLATTVMALSDPELHSVLELASDAELRELSTILYGRSLLSPLLKSLAPGDGSTGNDHVQHEKHEGRDALMGRLESRFLFLAADAKFTLSGRRPTYRSVLLQVRKKLNIPCPTDLSTEDMESEIFLHLLQQSSRKSIAATQASQKALNAMSVGGKHDVGARRWRAVLPTIIKLGGKEVLSTILKGGGAVTVSTLQRLVFKKLSGKVLLETARYQLAKEALVKTGQVAAMLETRVAVLAAKQGLIGAAKRFVTLRSAMMVLGPMLWGTLLADMVISAVGTDYARVVRAICAFAQIRLMRTYNTDAEQIL